MKWILNTALLLLLLGLFTSCETIDVPPSDGDRPNVMSEEPQDGPEGVTDSELGDESVPREVDRKF